METTNTAEKTGNLHPIFAGILAGIEQQPEQIKRAQYASRLARFDWSFEYCDDGIAYRAARDELAALRELQVDLDPDGEIWNRAAAKANASLTYLITRAVKVECDLPDGGREVKWLMTGMSNMDLVMHFTARHGDMAKVKVTPQPASLAFEQTGGQS